MAQQTAVEFLITQLGIDKLIKKEKLTIAAEIIEQARQIEKERGVIAYNIGYQDAQCNHINDAENYIHESNTRI